MTCTAENPRNAIGGYASKTAFIIATYVSIAAGNAIKPMRMIALINSFFMARQYRRTTGNTRNHRIARAYTGNKHG